VHGSSQSNASGHWRVTLSQHKPSGIFQYRQAQQLVSKPRELPPRICYNCRQPGHYANECPNPRNNKPEQQNQNPGVAKGNRDKNPTIQVKQGQLNFTGNFLSENIPHCGLLMMELCSILTPFLLFKINSRNLSKQTSQIFVYKPSFSS
jgi:hypothetical protein